MATPSNQLQHSRSGLRLRSSSRAPKLQGRRPSSSSSSDDDDLNHNNADDPDPFDSYSFIILLNLVNLIGSIPMFVALFFLKIETGVKELTSLVFFYTVYNISLLVSPLLGILASAFRRRRLARAHVVCFALVLIPATVGFLLFFDGVTIGGHGHEADPTTIRNVTEYSSWLRQEVEDPQLWSKVRKDLVEEKKVCSHHDDDDFEQHIIFLGCCTNSCDKEDESYYYNASCVAWNEDPGELCYDCESCRSAVLGEINFRLALCVPMFVVTLAFHGFTTIVVLLVSFLGLKE